MSPMRRLPEGVGTLLWTLVGIIALVYAVQGGEYSTLDLFRQHRQTTELRSTIDSLHHVVDSLSHYRDRLLHDPKLQERIGREEFGWVKGDKEMLYRFDTPDSTGR